MLQRVGVQKMDNLVILKKETCLVNIQNDTIIKDERYRYNYGT